MINLIEKLHAELEQTKKDRDFWKASHDNQVKLKQAIAERPDLGDRAAKISKLIEENQIMRDFIEAILNIDSLDEFDDPHNYQECYDRLKAAAKKYQEIL